MKILLAGVFALAATAASPAIADHQQHGGAAHHASAAGGGGNHHMSPAGGRTMHIGAMHQTHASRMSGRSHYLTHRSVTTRTRFGSHRVSVTTHRRFTSRNGVRHVTITRRTARFASLRRAFRAPHRFRIGIYRRPYGWYSHRWVIGEWLPRGWFVRDYWITDFGLYGLLAPPDGLIWVRVGPDAMLIDEETGEVIQVEYGLFY